MTFLALLLTVLVTVAAACPAENHIFLIHGIGGSARSFGALGEVLEGRDPCYRVRTFEYKTGMAGLSAREFSRSFEARVESLKRAGAIGPEDKISLIMHSQGGIVGHLWMNRVRARDPETFAQVDAFITLATPHWGADLANFGHGVVRTLPNRWEDLSPLGRGELNEMSFGSATIRDLAAGVPLVFTARGPRPLAVAGLLGPTAESPREDDAAVPVYSARPELLRAVVPVELSERRGRIPASVFEKTSPVPFVVVRASHVRLWTFGIASIPRSCLTGCRHPTLRLILDHLAGRRIAEAGPELRQYRVTVFVAGDSARIDVAATKLSLPVHFPVPLEERLGGYRGKALLGEGRAFTFSGILEAPGRLVVPVRFRIRNLERVIEVPVEGGYSTMLELNLI